MEFAEGGTLIERDLQQGNAELTLLPDTGVTQLVVEIAVECDPYTGPLPGTLRVEITLEAGKPPQLTISEQSAKDGG